ncbi:hypothetical protein [Saccharothrix australiensis]|uniref:DoxX-like protein n=1 Tax=Saccharothrix australiensis TaxID=2072 RepID=A0A495W1C5_9PSEU|nr:hypothetical protein [Saccharothrix australiensis]RKT55472.1 hypothetical protein C8E97_4141 [Saccharothrix australiensis]
MKFFRVGLLFLTATQLVVGGWALLSPRGFYDGFPAPGHHWVAMFPPYNEHLVRDFGSLNLAIGVGLAYALVTLDRLLVRVVLIGYLLFAVPHMWFHLLHLDHMPVVDQVGNVVTLGLAVLVPLVLLVALRKARLPHREPAARS